MEYTQLSVLLDRLKDHELDARSAARQMRERIKHLEEELHALVEQDGMRVFLVARDQTLVVYSHCYGGQDWRMVKLIRPERLEA